MEKLTAEEALNSEFDLEELSCFIDRAFDQYKQDLKKQLTDLALKQIDERTVQPSNTVIEALLKLVDQD